MSNSFKIKSSPSLSSKILAFEEKLKINQKEPKKITRQKLARVNTTSESTKSVIISQKITEEEKINFLENKIKELEITNKSLNDKNKLLEENNKILSKSLDLSLNDYKILENKYKESLQFIDNLKSIEENKICEENKVDEEIVLSQENKVDEEIVSSEENKIREKNKVGEDKISIQVKFDSKFQRQRGNSTSIVKTSKKTKTKSISKKKLSVWSPIKLEEDKDDEKKLNLAEKPEFSKKIYKNSFVDNFTDAEDSYYERNIDGFSPKGTKFNKLYKKDSIDSIDSIEYNEHIFDVIIEEKSSNKINTDSINPFQIDHIWILDYNDCYFINQIGKGNSSLVFLGTFKNETVAIKVLKQESVKLDLEDFKKEMQVLSTLDDPHIIHFYGVTLKPKLCMITEYCKNGTLFHYLNDQSNYIDWAIGLNWMLQIVKSINTLHHWTPQILHRDIKSLNILIDEKKSIKICDFGLSRFISENFDNASLLKIRGTYAYLAPEVYLGSHYNSKSDIYSIGIILWEIILRIILGHHSRPFGEFKKINHDFQILIQSSKGLRPTLPLSTPQSLYKLYFDCVSGDPKKRPNSEELLKRIESILLQYNSKPENWDHLVKGGVITKPHRVENSSPDPNKDSNTKGGLLRSPMASRNLVNDLAKRGVSPILLRGRSESNSSKSTNKSHDHDSKNSSEDSYPIKNIDFTTPPGSLNL